MAKTKIDFLKFLTFNLNMFSRFSNFLKRNMSSPNLFFPLFIISDAFSQYRIYNKFNELETKINHLGHRHHNLFITKDMSEVKPTEKVYVMRQKTYDKYGDETIKN